MWEVHYSQEAATYLEDNGALIAGLFFAMEALADSDGIPTIGAYREMEGLIYWIVEGHWVIFRRVAPSRIARILFMKPE